jgi:segregation and condensation protein B
MELKSILESLLFVTDEPLQAKKMADITGRNEAEIKQALTDLKEDLTSQGRGIRLKSIAGGYRLFTDTKNRVYVEKLVLSSDFRRLTQAGLETLAIIAYRQPITRSEMAGIRGVSVDSVLANLVAKGLVKELGKEDVPGHPTLYGTTERFLESFGLDSLDELPALDGFEPDEETQRKIRYRLTGNNPGSDPGPDPSLDKGSDPINQGSDPGPDPGSNMEN